jgi:hypothetical protein
MNLSSRAVQSAREMIAGDSGLKVSVEALQELRGELAKEANFQVDTDHWNPKMPERVPPNRSPKVSIAMVKLHRGQKEKLAGFGALATLEIELASTHERADSLKQQVSDYVDALCDVLNRNQGLWSKGVYYAGGFTVDIAPISKGGLNFVQSATISLEIHLWQE